MSLFTAGHKDKLDVGYVVEITKTIPCKHEDGMDNRIIRLTVWYSNSNQHYWTTIKGTVSYPILISDVHVSSVPDKVFHCVVTAFTGCNM